MTTLSGEKIQNLLWTEGLDFQYATTTEGYEAIHIACGSYSLQLEHLWPEEEDWILDVGDVVLTHVSNDTNLSLAVFYSAASTEEELVQEIVGHYEKLS